MTTDPATVAWTIYELFNDRALDRLLGYVAEDVEWTDTPRAASFEGRAGYARYLQRWLTVLPNAVLEVRSLIGDEHWAAAEFNLRGSAPQTLPGTVREDSRDRAIDLPCRELLLIERGQVVLGRTYYDLATLLRQVGPGSGSPLPLPEAAAPPPGTCPTARSGRQALWRVADEVLIRYRAVSRAGVLEEPGAGPVNAARAAVLREVFTLLLTEILDRPPAREELASALALPARPYLSLPPVAWVPEGAETTAE